MSYEQTLDYLFSQLPMYQRIGPAAYKANLDNTLALSRYLNHPERHFKSIHVAGTNGKGSVSHMIASVLQEQGLKTGLATSPHLKDFRERIKINGQLVPQNFVSSFVKQHRDFFDDLKPSFFEMTMAMTFCWFAEQQVDMAVVETGLGGRLDSSNILNPEVSVITNIGWDHVNLLGPGLEDIAREKAGIIKENTPVIIGRRQQEVFHVFKDKAKQKHAPLYLAEDMFPLLGHEHMSEGRQLLVTLAFKPDGPTTSYLTDLGGIYQAENLRTALCVLNILKEDHTWDITDQSIQIGLGKVVANTGLTGRWHQLGNKPVIICDTAHNTDGLRLVLGQLKAMPHQRMHFVLGMVDDKDINGILGLFPRDADYYFSRPDVPRGLDAKKLAIGASSFGLVGKPYVNIKDALEAAKKAASPNDLIFVGGSTFVAAEVV